MSYDQNLADAEARIAQLEAALAERTAQYEYSAGVLAAANARLLHPEAEVLAPYLEHPLVEDATAAALRLAERDAALAAAHEALRRAAGGWQRPSNFPGSAWWFCRFCATDGAPTIAAVEHRPDCPVVALAAPALTRAAEELRLLRELEAAARRALILAAERWPEAKEFQAILGPPLAALARQGAE